ncbi:O-acyltransferase WSD1, C-terminal [Trema orientale]|uniref:O-acyltransferase WSD1, C-terminal n=1 Tax=Trema orientale TaxID=63057 RepID=A0A2P5FJN5_TREOI|nr:O-acyltransferase WSD1, C-terminal [Trema orientale]
MGFSNIVGPTEEISFYGHKMAFLAATTYGQPHELMVNFQSYVDKMTIVLSVDEAIVPDPHLLCNDIAESLKLIKDAVLERGLVK